MSWVKRLIHYPRHPSAEFCYGEGFPPFYLLFADNANDGRLENPENPLYMPLKALDVSSVIRPPEEVDRLFPWLRKDVLRGIPHFISPAWTEDRSGFDAVHYAKTWKRIGFDSVTLLTVHHDGYYLFPSKLNRNQPDRDYFGEQIKACHDEGLRTIAYYSLTLNNLAGIEQPDWLVRDLNGPPLVPDHRYFFHYHWLCVNSPFRDFAIGQLREIVTRYPVDAVWLDILYLPPHPSEHFLKPEQDTCFCAHCQRAYADWYQGESLFDAIGSPRHDEFRAESYRRFLFDLKKMLLEMDRPLALTFNGAGRRRCAFYDRVDELADWCSGEAHNMPTRNIFSDVLTKDGYPMELMSCSELVWSHNVSKPTNLVKLEAINTLLSGGTYTLGINHAPDGRLQHGNIERLVEWGEWIRNNAGSLREGTAAVEVGLLEAGQPLLIANQGFIRWVDFLTKSHLLFSIIREVNISHWPRCLIVPQGLEMTEELVIAVERYVQQGGRLLIEGPLQRRHRDGRYVLEELAGVQAEGSLKGHAFYLLPSAELSSGLIAEEPVYYQCGRAAVMTTRNGKALADLEPQFRDKVRRNDVQMAPNYPARRDEAAWYPGIVLHPYGKGVVLSTALALACPDHERARHPWPRVLAANIIRHLLGGNQAVTLASHEAVEVAVRRIDDGWRLHFLNHYYDVGEFISGEESDVRLHRVQVELDESFFGPLENSPKLFSGGSLAAKSKNGVLSFELPSLGIYESVTLLPTRRASGASVSIPVLAK